MGICDDFEVCPVTKAISNPWHVPCASPGCVGVGWLQVLEFTNLPWMDTAVFLSAPLRARSGVPFAPPSPSPEPQK